MANKKTINEDLEKGGEKEPIKKAKAVKAKRKTKRDDNYLFTLVIAAIVILGIIGMVFGYTKDKIAEIEKGGTEATKGLEEQVKDLKEELLNVKERAADLEKRSLSNEEVVLDLFDQNRKIPRKVYAIGWSTLKNQNLSFTVSFPKTWESIKPLIKTQEQAEEVVYLQPIGQADFINAVTIKSDYTDFAELDLEEKIDIFEELDALDSYDFKDGKMLYFINFDKSNKEVPTILILTDDNIYRATFNVSNKKLDNYFEYRKNFEEIVSTFALMPKIEEEKAEEGE